jgi:hypothetical protein
MYSKNLDIQKSGCMSLWCICEMPAGKKAVIKHNCSKAVIQAMKNHMDNLDIQTFGCSLLCKLLDDDVVTACATLIIQNDGLDVLVFCMLAHPSNLDIQTRGIYALSVIISID